MELFVKCQRDDSNCFMFYEGQDVATVERLLMELGATNISFMEETDWLAERPRPKG